MGNTWLVVQLLFYTSCLDVNQESDMNDARERTNDARTMSNKVFDERGANFILSFYCIHFIGKEVTLQK